MVKEITLKEMAQHFAAIGNKFDVRLLQAKRKIGDLYVRRFRSAFDSHGIVGTGDKWPARKRNYKHPMMKETLALMNSISYELKPGAGLTVFTDERKFPVGRRTSGSKSYAAFHNDPTGTHGRNVQRKFIGDSPYIEKEALQIIENIFKNLIV